MLLFEVCCLFCCFAVVLLIVCLCVFIASPTRREDHVANQSTDSFLLSQSHYLGKGRFDGNSESFCCLYVVVVVVLVAAAVFVIIVAYGLFHD